MTVRDFLSCFCFLNQSEMFKGMGDAALSHPVGHIVRDDLHLVTPITRSMREGPMPAPVQAPPAQGLELVTKGYVP